MIRRLSRVLAALAGDRPARTLLVPLLLAGAAAAVLHFGWAEKLELLTVDLRLRALPAGAPPPLVLVAIDQDSIRDIEAWPFPRTLHARALDALARAGALRVLVDLDFSSPGPDPAADAAFADAIGRAGNVFLAMSRSERTTPEGFLVVSHALPLPALDARAAGTGSIVFTLDADGGVRRAPVTASFDGRDYPPLGLLGARALDPAAAQPPAGAMFAVTRARVDSLPVVPFHRLLAGEFAPGLFRGKVAIIGPTAPELQDLRKSPVGVIPGPYLHAAVMEEALARSWLAPPPRWLSMLAVVLASLLLGQAMGRTGWREGALSLLAYLALAAGGAFVALRASVMIELVPLLALGLAQYPMQVALLARRTEKVLALERSRTDALLRMAELEKAEETGQEPYVVPLHLLRQVLGLSFVRLFLREGEKGSLRQELVFGEGWGRREGDESLLAEAGAGGGIIRVRGDGRRGQQALVPLRTVRRNMGVLAAGWPVPAHPGDKEMRLLLSYATQTAYFLESREMAMRMKEEETVRTNLARYLSPQIVEQVIANKVQVNLGGDRRTVTVLFSDIRDFTAITEGCPPDRLVAILNEYFSEMAAIIFRHRGSLDKYIGDAMVAVFGSLVEVENPAAAALAAAVEMMQAMPALNRRWAERYGGFTMEMGIGINSGEVFLGNIGSQERMEFTVIGDTVNVASRFSGIAGAGQVLLTRASADQAGAAASLRPLPAAKIKGKAEMLEVFEAVFARKG